MSTVADMLRQGRETQKLTIPQVAEITKIRTDHIRALEEGNFNVFSAPVYIRGFVRTCATVLKLDVAQTMAALDSELGRTEKFREPPSLTGEPRGVMDHLTLQLSKLDWRRTVPIVGSALGLIALILVFAAWHRHRASDPLAGSKPAVYEPSQDSGPTLPLPPARK